MPSPRPALRHVFLGSLTILGSAGLLAAQQPALPPAPSAASRLEALDATYKTSLRRVHAPVLQDYLRELELLKQQFTARSRPADARSVEVEIGRVRMFMETTGVMPYNSLEKPPESAPLTTAPSDAPAAKPRKTLVLHASDSRSPGAAVENGAKAIPLGAAEWTVTNLPAGTYDLTMVFASVSLPGPVQVQVDFAGKQVSATLGQDRATGSDKTFRLLHLGQVLLDRDVATTPLLLRGSGGTGEVLVRSLIFAESRGGPGSKTPPEGAP